MFYLFSLDTFIFFNDLTSESIRYFVLGDLLCQIWVHLGIQMWFRIDSLNNDLIRQYMLCIFLKYIQFFLRFDWSTKQTVYVGYFIICQIGVHMVMGQWYNQKLCIWYFTKIHSWILMIWPVNKWYALCYPIYCVNYGYIWAFKCDLLKTR